MAHLSAVSVSGVLQRESGSRRNGATTVCRNVFACVRQAMPPGAATSMGSTFPGCQTVRTALLPAVGRSTRPTRQVVRMANDAPFDPITEKNIVVTGANGKIGQVIHLAEHGIYGIEFCRQLLEKNNKVVAACRTEEGVAEMGELPQRFPESLTVSILDVSSAESIAAWASDLATKIDHVDVCINNAGVTGMENGYKRWDLEDTTAEDMMFTYAVNAVGPMLVVQQLLKNGLLGGVGSPSLVANMSSKVGSVEDNGSGSGYAYRASKAALNVATKSLSIDLAPAGITSVLLHPGYVRTKMTLGQGFIDSDESAAGLIRVMEGAAGPINGQWYDYKLQAIPW